MILYFSGTGNSKYVAQRMAEALNQSLLSMNDRIRSHDTSPVETDERLVIVTPTYAWRIPRLVRDWLLETEFPGAAQAWFIMTCGSEIGHAGRYNRSLCQAKDLTDMGTAQIIMPENYIAMFDAPQAEEARRIVAKAQPDIDRSIAAVRLQQVTKRLTHRRRLTLGIVRQRIEGKFIAIVDGLFRQLHHLSLIHI